MKTLLSFLAILFLFFIGVSCSNDDDPTPTPTPVTATYSASLQPVTGIGTSSHGTAKLLLNQTEKTVQITVIYEGVKPTHGHIQGADGEIVFTFPDTDVTTSPIVQTFSITDAQIAELTASHYYVNLPTIDYPHGEISGTFTKASISGRNSGINKHLDF